MKTLLALIIVAVIALALSNPDKEDLARHFAAQGTENVHRGISAHTDSPDVEQTLSALTTQIAGAATALTIPLIERKNYLLFSTFFLPGNATEPAYLGVAGFFVEL